MSDDDSNDPLWVYAVYASTVAPWAFMQFFDAIDNEKRHVEDLPRRLGRSLVLNFTSTVTGLWYVCWAYSRSRTESATMLIAVVLNSWYWKRNLRGWRSYVVLMSQKGHVCDLLACLMNMRMQGMPYSRKYTLGNVEDGNVVYVTPEDWKRNWNFLWVNDKVIDNDSRPYDVSLASGSWHTKIGGDVLWRMIWLQGTVGKTMTDRGTVPYNEQGQAAEYAPGDPPCHGEKRIILDEALDYVLRVTLKDDKAEAFSVPHLRAHMKTLSKQDQFCLQSLADEKSAERLRDWKPPSREDRIRSLATYDVGQQDFGGLPPDIGGAPTSIDALCCVMSSVTGSAPPPMENIWYESTTLSDYLEHFATDEGVGRLGRGTHDTLPAFPRLSAWHRIAGDLARLRDVPLLLSVREGKRYALRLASVSALLAYREAKYMALCVNVHQLGIRARWTHGWSGLVSCYTAWWTVGNVSIALLGGLPLLAIERQADLLPSVACLLVGLASENIMSMYLSDERRAARTKELARRYYHEKGKTCRGSGVKCVREALTAVGLPESASQLDGVVAFSVGWAKEAVDGLPGNQKPRDGQNHCQIEDLYSSSRAYRFPDERL